jgi:flagellar FliJ protein
MKRFRFPLQRVLQLREQMELERAAALGQAQRDEQARRDAVDQAEARLDRTAEQLREAAGTVTTAGALRNLGLTVDAAQSHLEAVEDQHRAAQEAMETEQERFGEARKERRVVERLRDRRHEAWTFETSREEQKNQDEIAARRWKEGPKP